MVQNWIKGHTIGGDHKKLSCMDTSKSSKTVSDTDTTLILIDLFDTSDFCMRHGYG